MNQNQKLILARYVIKYGENCQLNYGGITLTKAKKIVEEHENTKRKIS